MPYMPLSIILVTIKILGTIKILVMMKMSNMTTSSKIFYYFLPSISVGFWFLDNGAERPYFT